MKQILTCFLVLCCNHFVKSQNTLIFDTSLFKKPHFEQIKDDRDGQVYRTIKIGSQTWFVDNLKSTSFQNMTKLKNIKDSVEWGNCNVAAYCDIYNDTLNRNKYGILYNKFAAINNQNICPKGWKVPSFLDWSIMLDIIEYPNKNIINDLINAGLLDPLNQINRNNSFNSMDYYSKIFITTDTIDIFLTGVWIIPNKLSSPKTSGYP